jgi:hypothetical protein
VSNANRSGIGLVPQFGALGVVAVALAALWTGRPAPPKPTPDEPPAEPAKVTEEEKKPATTSRPTHLTKLYEFGVVSDPAKVAKEAVPTPKPDVRFLVVTVPDPVETQLGTRFDQMIDAVLRGMADVREEGKEGERGRFTLERYWYPWPLTGAKADAKEDPPAHRKYPGVLLFRGSRRSQAKWVVLLVGESPVAGVHPDAFQAALTLAAAETAQPLANAGDAAGRIRLVGPNFSGSQALLVDSLRAWQQDTGRGVRAISGSATGLLPANQLFKNAGHEPPKGITFELTQVPTEILNRAILHYLVRTGDSRPGDLGVTDANGNLVLQMPKMREVAYLVESNSGFGNLAAAAVRDPTAAAVKTPSKDESGGDTSPPPAAARPPSGESPWILRFPMHLSRLSGIQTQAVREREEQLGLAVPVSSQFMRLDEKRKGGDLLPSADEVRTALVNQRLLNEYWETLRRERVRYVGVLATDPRDTAFLIDQMRKEVPNAVVFVQGTDLQLTHPAYLARTRGVLMVSSYPLYPIAQEWARRDNPDGQRSRRRIPFATSGAEGTYNAVLAQCGQDERMLDYRPPAVSPSTQRQPAVWVSTVGEDGTILPLAYFDEYVSPVTYAAAKRAEVPGESIPPQTPPLRHLMLALIGCAIWGWVAIRRAFRTSPAGPDPRVVRRLKYQYATLIGVGLLAGCLPLAVYFYYLADQPPGGRPLWDSGTDAVLLTGAVGVAGLFGLFGLLSLPCQLMPFLDRRNLLGWRWRRTAGTLAGRGEAPWAERLPFVLHLVGAVAAATAVVGVVRLAAGADAGTRLLYLERAAGLGAGCSPVLAAGFVALGLFLYGVLSLSLLRLQTEYRVECPYPAMDSNGPEAEQPYRDVLNRIRDQAGRMDGLVIGLWTLMRRRGRTFLAVLAVATFVLALPPLVRAHWTWEGWAWDLATLAGVLALFVLAVVSAFRLYAVWKELERLLRLIGRVPMVGAFDRLPAEANRVFAQYLVGGRRRAEDLLIPHALLVRMERTTDVGTPVTAGSPPRVELPESIRARMRTLQLVSAPAAGAPAAPAGNGPLPAPAPQPVALSTFPDSDNETLPRDLSGAEASEFSGISRELVCMLLPTWVGRPLPEAYGDRVGAAADAEKARETAADPRWDNLAEQFIAIQAVIFVAQYFHQLRLMAYMAALPAGALLMAVTVYPFMPERLILFSAVGLVATVLAVLLWVLYRINKNTIVSRVTRTTPGRLSLDAGLVQNLMAFVLPLLTLAVVQVGGRWRTLVEPLLDLIR